MEFAKVLRVRCLQDDTMPQELGLMHQHGNDPLTYAALVVVDNQILFEAEIRYAQPGCRRVTSVVPGVVDKRWIKRHAHVLTDDGIATGEAAYRAIILDGGHWFDVDNLPYLHPNAERHAEVRDGEVVRMRGALKDGNRHGRWLAWTMNSYDTWNEYYFDGNYCTQNEYARLERLSA